MNNNLDKRLLVNATNLYKSFKTGDRYTKVLKDVSLDIYEGEFLIMFGPSGCGKSTLLHILMGLEKPDEGIVRFSGIDMWKMNSDDRADVRKRDLGIMYQQQNWIKSLTVKENIAFSAQLLGNDKETSSIKADEVLNIVGMTYRSGYVPSELSAGEQQKIGLARALITNPKMIIADEPTGNLDVKSGLDMMNLLKELAKKNITIVMVTHNPDYLEYSDRVIFMLDGKIYRETIPGKEDLVKIQKEIKEDLSKFISEGDLGKTNVKDVAIKTFDENDLPKKNILHIIAHFVAFNIKFVFNIISLAYVRVVKIFSKAFSEKERIKVGHIAEKLNSKKSITPDINALDLTEISFKNLLVKKSRTFITVLGMSLGIGFIVFLLSIGYGLERLVVNEISRIQSLNQVEVNPVVGSKIVLNEEIFDSVKRMEGVDEIYPLVNSAAQLRYEGSSIDVVAYGVADGYLERFPNGLEKGEYIKSENSNNVVVNKEYLKAMDLSPEGIIGKDIGLELVSFVKDKDADKNSSKDVYKVTGVIDDENPPVVYMSIDKLRTYTGEDYSQLTVVVKNSDSINIVRKQIEVMGLQTTSVMDTISQVENLFKYVKLGLGLLGIIAFTIAILGMINTLTVSLLERTREIGLMKTIGMKSYDIEALFLNESMLMGLFGGILGVFFGIFAGLLSTLIISLISVSKGGEFIMVSSLPIFVGIGIILVGCFVGFLTGLYPSRRAMRMAPLDALRYE